MWHSRSHGCLEQSTTKCKRFGPCHLPNVSIKRFSIPFTLLKPVSSITCEISDQRTKTKSFPQQGSAWNNFICLLNVIVFELLFKDFFLVLPKHKNSKNKFNKKDFITLLLLFLYWKSCESRKIWKVLINYFVFLPPTIGLNRKNVGAGAISSALSAHAGNLNGNVSRKSALFYWCLRFVHPWIYFEINFMFLIIIVYALVVFNFLFANLLLKSVLLLHQKLLNCVIWK